MDILELPRDLERMAFWSPGDADHGRAEVSWRPVLFHRGGLGVEARCPLAEWLEHGPRLCGLHPIARVEITGGVRAHPARPDLWFWEINRLVLDALPRPFDGVPSKQGGFASEAAAAAGANAAYLAWARPWMPPSR